MLAEHTTSFTLLGDSSLSSTRPRMWLQAVVVVASALAGSAATYLMTRPGTLELDANLCSAIPDSASAQPSPSSRPRAPRGSIAICEKATSVDDVKSTVCRMDHALVSLPSIDSLSYDVFERVMEPFWTPDFEYIPMYGVEASKGMRGWWDAESMPIWARTPD